MKHLLTRAFALASLLTITSLAQASAQTFPFAGLAGGWSGSGSIALSAGLHERLRCRATYQVSEEGSKLRQSLRCASDSYRVDLNSDLVAERGAIRGSWQETSRNINGSISGHASGGKINAVADVPGFSARISVASRGNRHSITISSDGDIRNVSISLNRS